MKAELKQRNYYQALGLPRGATLLDIKRAYRRMAKKHHPDKKGETRSEEFVIVQEAYDVLSDPERRRKYDRWGDPDYNEELMARLQMMHGPAGHPFFRFALRYHYRRMAEVGCPDCPEIDTCPAWRERMQVIDCPKKRNP